jgi:beta-lactamase class A
MRLSFRRSVPVGLVLALSCARAQPLERALRERIAQLPATVSLYAKNLETGARFGIREAEPVRTASTIKLAIMMAVFDAVAHGQAKFDEPLTITPQEKVSGSGVLGTEFSDHVQLPLRDVMHLMIVLSDNTATNMILERFSADSVNAYLDRIGIRNTRAMRKILGSGPAQGVSAAGSLGISRSPPDAINRAVHARLAAPDNLFFAVAHRAALVFALGRTREQERAPLP